jgi:hypothetical protein
MTEPTYLARIYRPVHTRQKLRHDGKLIGCTETCTKMLADAVTFGALHTTELECRELSGEWPPNDKSPGLNLRQVETIAGELRIDFYNKSGEPWARVVQYLGEAENRRVIAQLWAADIGGPAVDHAVLLQALRLYQGRAQVLANDPLRATEEWFEVADIRKAMETFADRHGVPDDLRFGVSRPLPYVAQGA